MRKFVKSVLCIALCSIAAIATCNAGNKFKPVESLANEENALRWQQQLKWTAGAYDILHPELKLLGWREVGTLSSQEQIDKFLKDGVDENRLYSHTIDVKSCKYEIAPLGELAKKYDVWKNASFENAKKIYGSKLASGAKVVELKWQYKGKKFVEKIAVTDKHDDMGGIIFSTIHIPVDSNKVPLADWQKEEIKQREIERQKREEYFKSPEGQKMLREHMQKNGQRTSAGK